MNATGFQELTYWPASPVVRLREIARLCESCQPLDPLLARWLGGVLNAFLERETASLEEIMGLHYGRGGLPWRRAEAMRERDEALRTLSHEFFADLGPCARAREIATLAARYGASAWRIDRNCSTMPERYIGRPQSLLWQAFKSGATMPLGERQIRNIIGNSVARLAAPAACSRRRRMPC